MVAVMFRIRVPPLAFCFCLSLVVLVGCAAPMVKGNASMEKDEQSIRQWYQHWLKATREGHLDLARSLIADDAVFLVPDAGRMDKESFAAGATATDPNTDFHLESSIHEIKVLGDHAWLWSSHSLTMTDKTTKTRTRMAGHSLSILQRQGEGWVVIRDANTLVPVPD
jgi:uncharacterized protein (TIGR02246 family)